MLLGAALGAPPAAARVLLTQEEALAIAFGDASKAERRTAYLTEEQVRRVREAAGTEPGSRVVVYYTGPAASGGEAAAYFDTHLVRTLPETVMIVVDPGRRVRRVDILSFDEPEEYLPKSRWLDQFAGRGLDEDLSLRRGIRGVTGATLSSRAITDSVRRALALDAALRGAPAEEEP